MKSVESIAEKVRQKELDDPLGQVEDLVGIRVVALFLSDLPRLDELIRESFEIHASDNKITAGDPASFGYMSMHYLASLDGRHSGPRYDDLIGVRFEIQTRTVVMDAWANVSHYLDYKGESSIPEDLRKDFYALSGLFYVADQHFELFAELARRSQIQAAEDLDSGTGKTLEINLDTLEAFLQHRYPDRRHGSRRSISVLAEEITAAGIQDIGALAQALDRANSAFSKYEEADSFTRPGEAPTRLIDIGAARVALALTHRDFGATYKHRQDLSPFFEWRS